MSDPSSSRQRSISASDLSRLESRVSQLEQRFPVEIRVIVSERGGDYPNGGVRGILSFLVLAELAMWYFWVEVPWWVFCFVPLSIVYLPSGFLSLFRLGRLFSSKREVILELKRRAYEAFQKYGVGETESGNGLMVYFSLPEKKFYFVPDTDLSKKLGAGVLETAINHLAERLKGGDLVAALEALFDHLDAVFQSRLPDKTVERGDEIPNSFLFET